MVFISATQDSSDFSTELITPEKAREYLGNQFRNRAIRKTKIRDYVRQMKIDKWLLNGEPLIFDKNGRLIDGQHRLTAVIEADTPQMFDIRRNVDASAAATIDTGASRRMFEQLTIGKLTVNSQQLGVMQNIYSTVGLSQHINKRTDKYDSVNRMGSTVFSTDAVLNRQIVTHNRSLLNVFENAGFLKPAQNKLVTAVGMKLAIYVENQRKLFKLQSDRCKYDTHGIIRGLQFVDIVFNGFPELFEPDAYGIENSAAPRLFKYLANLSTKQSKTVYNEINNAGFKFANEEWVKQVSQTQTDPFPLIDPNTDNTPIVDSFKASGGHEACSMTVEELTRPTYGSI